MRKSEIFSETVRAVCEVTELEERLVLSRSRREDVVDARHLLVEALRRGGLYPSEIARMTGMTGRNVRAILSGFGDRAERSPGLRMSGAAMANNNRGSDPAVQAQIDSLRNQMADNQNSNLLMDAVKGTPAALGQLAQNLNCDFGQLQSAVCAVQSAIQQVGGKIDFSAERVINAVSSGDCSVIQAVKDCCCQTQQNIIRTGYENQLGQKDILNGIERQTNTLERGDGLRQPRRGARLLGSRIPERAGQVRHHPSRAGQHPAHNRHAQPALEPRPPAEVQRRAARAVPAEAERPAYSGPEDHRDDGRGLGGRRHRGAALGRPRNVSPTPAGQPSS